MIEKLPQICWIFDVDGVITNPSEKRVTEAGLIKAIAAKIDRGDMVTLNTGRSVSWMNERVIVPLKEAVQDKNKLDDFLAVAEKGGVLAYFDKGELKIEKDETITIPDSLKEELRNVIQNQFPGKMFYDESKMTMLSTEMVDGRPISEFSQEQEVLIGIMENILSKPEYQSLGLRIDPTTIATDIQNAHVGKHFGARRIAKWLEKKGIKPDQIVTVGDSQSDTEMAEELQDEFDVKFVFVGDRSKLDSSKLKNPPIFTQQSFGNGTLEYLQN